MSILVYPSLLAANPLNLEADLQSMEAAGADGHHMDTMDGHFVPNLAFGHRWMRAVAAVSAVPVDVHLMVSNPAEHLLECCCAGVQSVSFHREADGNHSAMVSQLRDHGIAAGIAVSPRTPIESLSSLLPSIDHVLVMGVSPGFGGQAMLPQTPARISWLARHRQERGYTFRIHVDGGVQDTTAPMCLQAGADVLVVGSHLYQAGDRQQCLANLRKHAYVSPTSP